MGKIVAYYNEFDPMAAAWLRELIKAGLIPDGEVDTRSIVDVRRPDLRHGRGPGLALLSALAFLAP